MTDFDKDAIFRAHSIIRNQPDKVQSQLGGFLSGSDVEKFVLAEGANKNNLFHIAFKAGNPDTIKYVLSKIQDISAYKKAMLGVNSASEMPLDILLQNKDTFKSFVNACSVEQFEALFLVKDYDGNSIVHLLLQDYSDKEFIESILDTIGSKASLYKQYFVEEHGGIVAFLDHILAEKNSYGASFQSLNKDVAISTESMYIKAQAFSLSERVSSFYESATEALSSAKDSIFSSLSPYESATEALSPAMNPVSNSLSSFRNVTENNALVIENAIKIKSVSFLNKKTHSTVPPVKAAKKTYDFSALTSTVELQRNLAVIDGSEVFVNKIDNKKFVVEYKGAKTSYDKLKKAAKYCEQLCNGIDSKAISVKPYLGDKALQNINNALHITETAMHVADDVTQLFGKAMSYFDQDKDQYNNSTEWKQYTSAGLNPIIANALGQSESNVVVAKESLYTLINIAQWKITGLGTNLIPVAQQGVVVSSAILDVDPTYSDEISLGVAVIGSVVSIYAMPASTTIIAVSLLPSVASYGMKSLGYSDDYHVVTTLDTIALSINIWKGSFLLKGVSGIKFLNIHAENIGGIASSVYEEISQYVSGENIGEIASSAYEYIVKSTSSVYERISEYVSDQGSAKVDDTDDIPTTNTTGINGIISNNIDVQRAYIKKLQPCNKYDNKTIHNFFNDPTCTNISNGVEYKECIGGLLNSKYNDVTDCESIA